MAKGPENKFRDNKLRPVLDALPMEYFIKEAVTLRGIPDIIGVMNGRFIALEVKKNHAELSAPRTKLQLYRMERYRFRGGYAEFIYPENARKVIVLMLSFCGVEKLIPTLEPLLDAYLPDK